MYDIAILGSGYAGVWAMLAASELARSLRAPLRIALVAPEPVLVARPRLYESDLAERDARIPLGKLIAASRAEFVPGWGKELGELGILVLAEDRERWLAARSVIVATGSNTVPPPGVEAYTIDSYPAARRFWADLRAAAEAAGARRPELMIVGAGLTGIEAASEAARRFAGRIDVHLVDPNPELRGWSGPAQDYLRDHLAAVGVRLQFERKLVAGGAGRVRFDDGTQAAADLLLWTAGLRPQELARCAAADAADDGRVAVDELLRSAGNRNIFWAGDVAAAPSPDTGRTSMSCQYAMQLGTTAGRNAVLHLLGRPLEPFRPRPYVTCVGLGEEAGLFTEGAERKVKFTGRDGARVKKYIVEEAIVPVPPRLEAA